MRVLAYFLLRMAETPIYELPVKNLTSPFASATPIFCNRGITLNLSEYRNTFSQCFGGFFSAHAQK